LTADEILATYKENKYPADYKMR